MNEPEIKDYFNNMCNDQDVSAGVAAIKTLLEVLKQDNSGTLQELEKVFLEAIDVMKNSDQPTASVSSGCALFLRFITLIKDLDNFVFDECKKKFTERGNVFLDTLNEARGKVAGLASSFISDGCVILTHSKSRVVLQTIREAAKSNRRFKVFVTNSSPDNTGEDMHRLLVKDGIDSTLIIDSAIGYVMEQVDLVMVGAEGVAESGGIINKIGTYMMAMCAKELKKPVYVLTESFKFNRVYPLNQKDLPNEFKYLSSSLKKDLKIEHPLVDYTPPSYITLLFTDIGILTPSAVSDELIKLYL